MLFVGLQCQYVIKFKVSNYYQKDNDITIFLRKCRKKKKKINKYKIQ